MLFRATEDNRALPAGQAVQLPSRRQTVAQRCAVVACFSGSSGGLSTERWRRMETEDNDEVRLGSTTFTSRGVVEGLTSGRRVSSRRTPASFNHVFSRSPNSLAEN